MLQGSKTVEETPSKKKDLRALARRYRVLNALEGWARRLASNEKADLGEVAKDFGVSRRSLLKALREDQQIQDEVFGGMTTKAKLAVTGALDEALRCMTDPDQSTQTKLAWATFCARLASIGGFGKRDVPQVLIANLIPDLPANFITADKVIDVTPTKLEDIEAE